MGPHVCPWWGGYLIDNWFRRWLHDPESILAPYVTPGMTVMDFGCGMGLFTIAMARLVGDAGRVIAVDVQQQMLDVLRRRATKAGVAGRIETHRSAPDTIGVEGPLDFALAFWSAHEVPDLPRWLTEVYGDLRPGGSLLVVEPRGHVTPSDFQGVLSRAEVLGFRLQDTPSIRWSLAALLRKPAL